MQCEYLDWHGTWHPIANASATALWLVWQHAVAVRCQ